MNFTPPRFGMLLCAVALLSACGGGGDSPLPAPPPTYTVGGEVSGLPLGAQVTLQLNGSASVVARNPGALAFTFPEPLSSGSTYSVTLDSARSDRNCRIDQGSGTVGAEVRTVQVRCSDVFAFVANTGPGGGVTRYAVGGDGQLAPLGTTPASHPQQVALSPSGQYAYVANGDGASILQFSVGADGSFTPLSPAKVLFDTRVSPRHARAVVLDSRGRYAWAADADGGRIYQYAVSANGTLSPLGTPWVAGPEHPSNIAYDGNCHCVIVTEMRRDGDIQVWDVAADGSLRFKMAYGASMGGSALLVLGPQGWVLVSGQGQIAQWSLNSSGALSRSGSLPSEWTRALAADPHGQVVWAVSQGGSSIRPYQVGVGGLLTAGADITSGGLSRPTAIASNGRHVYVTNSSSNTVSQYAVGSTATGALTPLPLPTVGAGDTPNSVTLY